MIWIFNIGVFGFGILFYSVVLNGIIGCISFQIWKIFKRIWQKNGAYGLLYNLLKIVILLFVIPFGWCYVTLSTYRMDAEVRYYWYPWVNSYVAFILFGLFVTWIVGAIYHLRKYIHEKISLRNIRIVGRKVTDKELEKLYKTLSLSKYTKKKIPIVVCHGLYSPMVTGIFRRYIYLPDHNYDTATLKIILSHELTHVQHKDLLFKNLCALITIAYWFIPLFNKIFREYDGWSEVLCDMDLCVNNNNVWTAKQYYTVLINEIERSGTQNFKMCSALYETENTLKWRVESMKNYREMRGKPKLLAALLAATFLFSCPATVFAASNTAKLGLDEVYEYSFESYDESNISQAEYSDSAMEKYGNVLDDGDVLVIEVNPYGRATQGSYTWDIAKGSKVIVTNVSLKKGQTLSMGVSITSGSGPVDAGLVLDTTKRYVTFNSSGVHNFEIKEDGKYKLFVENKSGAKITVDFNYFTV